MGFWNKSLQIFNCLCDNATQSEWLTRLVVATLYTFGLERGVGLDTMREFFARLHLTTQVRCSASALRGVMQALETALLQTAAAREQDGQATGEGREIIGAVDATFLERMILVCMDLTTGYLLFEEVAEDRSYVTWKACVEERLKALGPSVRYLVSDRTKALIQLAEQGLECLSMPDVFHVVHEIVQSYALAIGRRLHQAHQQLVTAEHALASRLERTPVAPATPQAQAAVEARRLEVQRWEEVHSMYRHHLETLSLTLHPCTLHDATPQTSAQVHTRLHAASDAMDRLAQEQQVHAFQRISSAVDGRHGVLAQLHHNQRGLPKRRWYKVWTVLHNFDCRATDDTTPTARFFRRTFPDLFETVLSHIEVLPRARQRKEEGALCH